MEFGGLVCPPSHLSTTGNKKAPEGRPAELRTVPDYDYGLFRYSSLAFPWLLLIIVSSAMLMGLSFWQGPFGFKRGQNGLRDGIPLAFELNDNLSDEAGLKKSLKGLRAANFIMGILPAIVTVFALSAGLTPGPLRGILILCSITFFALGCTSSVSFALGIDEVHWMVDCPKLTFPFMHFSPTTLMNYQPASICRTRENISTAAIVADAAQAFSAFILSVLLIYTTQETNWAWGPGNVPVELQPNKPKLQYPPPSPFTHIAQTRRMYVWTTLFFTTAFVLVAFILMLKLHELRQKPQWVDSRNSLQFTSGWYQSNNRFRVALTGFCIAGSVLSIMDLIIWERRLISYLLAIFLFWIMVGFYLMFALDIRQVGDAGKISCPAGSPRVPIKCVQWQFFGTCFMDFWTAFLLMVYLAYEFLYRVTSTWDSCYFYADSEWLRNHSLFVVQTDREAFDWKKFTMDTGKEYFYSPSLGISTSTRPRNYIEPEASLE